MHVSVFRISVCESVHVCTHTSTREGAGSGKTSWRDQHYVWLLKNEEQFSEWGESRAAVPGSGDRVCKGQGRDQTCACLGCGSSRAETGEGERMSPFGVTPAGPSWRPQHCVGV